MDFFAFMDLQQQHEAIAAILLIAQGVGWWLMDQHTRHAVTKALNGHNQDNHAHAKPNRRTRGAPGGDTGDVPS